MVQVRHLDNSVRQLGGWLVEGCESTMYCCCSLLFFIRFYSLEFDLCNLPSEVGSPTPQRNPMDVIRI